MKIGHLSDIHLFAMDPAPRPAQFLNKRMVGGLNLLLHRKKVHGGEVVQAAFATLETLGVDHIAVSGDLTNLAMDAEFRAAAQMLGEVPGAPGRVSVVPGNHDYYIGAVERRDVFRTHLGPFMQSDLPAYAGPTGFPYVHLRGEVAIVGLNSGIASPWLFATGRVREDELARTAALLKAPELQGRTVIVMLHHPLFPCTKPRREYHRRLVNAAEVLELLLKHRVDLVIHGHNHHWALHRVARPDGNGEMFVCEAGSAAVASYKDPMDGGKFNVYEVEGGRLQSVETWLYDPADKRFALWRRESLAPSAVTAAREHQPA